MTTPAFSVSGLMVLVVGAARSGVAAARLLARRGATVTLTDRKSDLPEAADLAAAGVRLELGGHPLRSFETANLVVMSPGVPLDLPEVRRARSLGIPVIGELELASRWLRGPIVAITGTKGKSTTTTLVGRMLAAAGRRVLVGGNIGYPVSGQVEASTADTVHVIEASSFQLEATDTFRPWIAALLNFSPDHLDRHPDEASYAAAKTRIFANQQPHDWAVVNADNAAALAMAQTRAQVVRYAVDHPDGVEIHAGRGFVWQRTSEGDVPLLPLAAVQLAGRHMLSNVVAATAISHLAGATEASLAQALDGFTGLEHVMEPVGRRGGVRFVNDSKATNIEAAARSIESFDKVVAIVGGKYKGGDFADLAAPLRAHGRAVVAIGEARPMVTAALAGVVPVVAADGLADAVRRAWDLAVPDGVVLLAPACSSFDMFRDYADRGARFKEEVQRLIAEP
ncbi:MAG: UDP-N-acetylmuramoyl-L-alanine--D-glutamate ligase [Acidobacteriota bacterium]|nr:UDP-N-acetylmuramoyl-L-alanine--D-glutamate ligase [Acidobacteriota bacterium]